MKQYLSPAALRVRPAAAMSTAAIAAALLAACGGGADAGAGLSTTSSATGTAAATGTGTAPIATKAGLVQGSATTAATTTTHADAVRLLTQATFGPTAADVSHAMSIGAAAWVDEQLAKPVSAHHTARWNSDNTTLSASGLTATPQNVESSFWQEALTADDQLRQRVTLALSEIFVVSMQNLQLASNKSQTSASYLDMLANHAFGNYRDLLEAVTLHPAMGQYLDMLGNMQESPSIGRIPDQNYSREVMQLFSIGLVQLNVDGSPKLDAYGKPIPTYAASDIDGLSRVFTGWSWGGPDTTKARFVNAPSAQDPNRLIIPMQAYPQYHSLSAKTFLGRTIAATTTSDPVGEMKVALDTIANHPNVGPFVSRQLIQRLVTSNPSPAYVARVASVFNNDGTGVRGNLKAVVRAILLDNEARDPALAASSTYGKLREPILRLSAFLRAYPVKSDSGLYLIGETDDPGLALAQSALRARSVFNFYRPGYVQPGGVTAQKGMVAPELQIATETSVAGYANFMQRTMNYGLGLKGLLGTAAQPDVHVDLSAAQALATDPVALVNDTCARLIGDNVNASLKTQIQNAVASVTIPVLNKTGSNAGQIDKAKWNRAYIAVLLTLASPEFTMQR